MVFKNNRRTKQQGTSAAGSSDHSTATRPTATSSKQPVSNWRGDVLKSKSDWIIHVVAEDDGKSGSGRAVYHVHTKVIDELTPRRVPYFEPIFKDKMRQIGDRTSELKLPSDVAQVFDKLLDFLYCDTLKKEEEFLLNLKNGLALSKAAEHFQIDSLQSMLTKFYRDQMIPFHLVDEQQCASVGTTQQSPPTTEKERQASEMETFARTMHTLEVVDEGKLEPLYLLKVLKKRKELNLTSTKIDSENISCLIALCTRHYRDQLTRKIFYKLTQEVYIPRIDQEAALQLLTVETELGYWTDTDNFSTVQARCIQSLLSDWTGLRQKFESDAAFWKTLRELSPNVLGILLMQSTGTSQEAEERVDESTGRDQPPHDEEQEDRYEI
ncbi:MAG: hypothetical protein SGILL_000942 [Bacillariaceae sp.]